MPKYIDQVDFSQEHILVQQAFNPRHISLSSSAKLIGTDARLHTMTVGEPKLTTIKIYNSDTSTIVAETVSIISVPAGVAPFTLHYDVGLNRGLVMLATTATDVAISWRGITAAEAESIPTSPSLSPSLSPSISPSYSPSKSPSYSPSLSPSLSPSISPSPSS